MARRAEVSDEETPTSVRLPGHLRRWLKEQADFYRRDVSAQLVWYLEGVRQIDQVRAILDSRKYATEAELNAAAKRGKPPAAQK